MHLCHYHYAIYLDDIITFADSLKINLTFTFLFFRYEYTKQRESLYSI